MELKVKKLHPDAVIPKYATDGAACFDLVAIGGTEPHEFDDWADIYRTGLAFEVPPGWVMLIFSRSGHGFKLGMRLSNCVGVIDSDYRGEVKVSIRDDSCMGHHVDAGQRIAQAMLVQIPRLDLVEVAELSSTDRGAGGFGSTGSGAL